MALAAAALPLIGATLGGIQGFRQSGGDLGAAALGAGIGATGGYYLPAGVRMAGQALMGLPGVSSAMSAASPKAFQALQGLKAVQGGAGVKGAVEAAKAAGSYATHPLAQQLGKGALAKGITGAAVLGGSLALPGLAGGAANLLSAPVRAATGGIGQVGQQGLGMVAAGQPYVSNYGANLPPGASVTDPYGGITPAGLPGSVLGLPGLGQTLEAQRQGRATAENLQRYGDIDLAFREVLARKDFERQAAMKGIAQNIATQAAMIQNAQSGAQQLGQTFGQGISQNIGRIYQYT